MLAPSLPLLGLPDRGTADRNQNPFPQESRTDVASHKRRKRFSTSFMSSRTLPGQWYAILARPLRSRERGGLPELIERAVIEDRTIECFRIPFRHHRRLQCPRLSHEVHCAMAKQP
jgi:hypothetical protein